MVLPEKVLRSFKITYSQLKKSWKMHLFIGFPQYLSNFRVFFCDFSGQEHDIINGLWFLNLLLKTFSVSTMKPYFRCNDFLTPTREVGVFLKVLCGHNFCTTEIFFCMAYFFALIKHFLCGRQNFIIFFQKRDRPLCIYVV